MAQSPKPPGWSGHKGERHGYETRLGSADPKGKRSDFHEAHPDYMLPDKASCCPAWCLQEARDYWLLCASNAAELLADDLLRALEEESASTCSSRRTPARMAGGIHKMLL